MYMGDIKRILVLFKTHLDVGFTDYAGSIMQKYRTTYIPNALKTARALREEGTGDRLIWTTGSFLIWDYLRHASEEQRAELDEAVRAGDISWHGLPFTTHTELMDRELFEFGLSLSGQLDKRYGRRTIGAKMTDVPGHTTAIVPLLAGAGIRFLHIGVNPASTIPDVPQVFRWRYEGSEVAVMYNDGYGEFTRIPGTDTAVYFAHTGDNHGPQSPEQIKSIYAGLREQYPDAELAAADMNMLAEEVLAVWDSLPVRECEIGDTWIHGVGSDPRKVRLYRHLLRHKGEWGCEERGAALPWLLMVPEHTWGMDIKTHLADHSNYRRADFERVRTAPNYARVEASWAEQRAYLGEATAALAPGHRAEAEAFDARACRPTLEGYERVAEMTGEMQAAGWRLRFGDAGELRLLERDGSVYADAGHRWGQVLYRNHSPREYAEFYANYVPRDADWAREDFGKIGMEDAISCAQQAVPVMKGLYRRGDEFISLMEIGGACRELYGAPAQLALRVTLSPDEVRFELDWWDKAACRVPESIWCGFVPAQRVEQCRVSKLGSWIDPETVCGGGGRHLHATDRGVRWNGGCLETLDTALVSVGRPRVMPYTREPVDVQEGFWFGLENNLWGTNFVMWYDEDASFRWVFRP